MKIPKTYQTNDQGFTQDGYYLPKSPYKTIPDVFKHPGPLPTLTPSETRVNAPIGEITRNIKRTRVASLDEEQTKAMRFYYGVGTGINDGAKITHTLRTDHEIENEPQAPMSKIWTTEEIAEAHGRETLRRINAKS